MFESKYSKVLTAILIIVIIAIIGACGAVLAAVIAGVFGLIKQSKSNNFDKKVKIRQSAKGSNNTQIGIQNIAKADDAK